MVSPVFLASSVGWLTLLLLSQGLFESTCCRACFAVETGRISFVYRLLLFMGESVFFSDVVAASQQRVACCRNKTLLSSV
jgi:hypothetical protein